MSNKCCAIASTTKQQCRNNAKPGQTYCSKHLPKIIENIPTRECSICMEDRTNFKVFRCKHELCTECLKAMRSLECPFCRRNFEDALTDHEKAPILRRINSDREPVVVQQLNNIIHQMNLFGYFLNNDHLLLVGSI